MECETLEMVQEAVEAGADIIMLDNMNHDQMLQAVTYIAGRAQTEASGNVDAANAAALCRPWRGFCFLWSAYTFRANSRSFSLTPGGFRMSANSGEMRREKILEALRGASGPLSGAALAEQCGLSRESSCDRRGTSSKQW